MTGIFDSKERLVKKAFKKGKKLTCYHDYQEKAYKHLHTELLKR